MSFAPAGPPQLLPVSQAPVQQPQLLPVSQAPVQQPIVPQHLSIQVPVIDVHVPQPYRNISPSLRPILTAAPQTNWYWVAAILLAGLIVLLIWYYWREVKCLFAGCPRVKNTKMLDQDCQQAAHIYCDCCPDPVRICCSDPWVKNQFSHWSNNPAANKLLLDGVCQRLFNNPSSKHQSINYEHSAHPPCQTVKPTPGPAPAPAPGPMPPAPSPIGPTPPSPIGPTPLGPGPEPANWSPDDHHATIIPNDHSHSDRR